MKTNKYLCLMMLPLLAFLAGCDGFLSGGGGNNNNQKSSDRTLAFYYGPLKLMIGENMLDSIEIITGHDFGGWDYTAPDPASAEFTTVGNQLGAYYTHCRLFGGCMDHRIPQGRTSFVGTGFVLELEKAVTEACYDPSALAMFPATQVPDASVQAIDVINHQYMQVFSEPPSSSDLEVSFAYFESHLVNPEFTNMSAMESAGRGHCRALLTTNRFLSY